MKTILALGMALTATASTLACGDYASFRNLPVALDCSGQTRLTLDDLTRDAVGTDRTRADTAIRMLRARGPEGLRALLEANAAVVNKHATATPLLTPQQPDDSWPRVKAALDGVSGQRDCHASRLYWYTDFEQAKAAAQAQAKPILSLRLLGKLDEEFSCANSRFFRTRLYANAEVSHYLRDHFILHWKSVRPAPRVTIDFGDGRKLERTITGNSIHYVLAADGSVIDGLPGLYGAEAFVRGLHRAEAIARQTASAQAQERSAMVTEYHLARIASLQAEFAADLEKVSTGGVNNLPRPQSPPGAPAEIGDATWSRIAALHQEDFKLDVTSRTLIRAKHPTAFEARRAAVAKTFVEDPLLRQIRSLERSISEDTCRNEYLLHPKIHAWLATGAVNLDELNRKVYAELFLTPDSDPWLGLLPSDTFTALENNGVAQVGSNHSKSTTATAIGL